MRVRGGSDVLVGASAYPKSFQLFGLTRGQGESARPALRPVCQLKAGDRMSKRFAAEASGGSAEVRNCKMPCRNAGKPRSIIVLVVARCSGPLHVASTRKVADFSDPVDAQETFQNPAPVARGIADGCLNVCIHCLPGKCTRSPHPGAQSIGPKCCETFRTSRCAPERCVSKPTWKAARAFCV